ncbi:MAG TPA: hypothetical protein VKA90_00915 [Beijerinckiaceae bacterium]|nr:hypothetical protein [Beijerinckiaceae bacterium]
MDTAYIFCPAHHLAGAADHLLGSRPHRAMARPYGKARHTCKERGAEDRHTGHHLPGHGDRKIRLRRIEQKQRTNGEGCDPAETPTGA